jgi:hypothetical protein
MLLLSSSGFGAFKLDLSRAYIFLTDMTKIVNSLIMMKRKMNIICPCCYEKVNNCPEVVKLLAQHKDCYIYQRDALDVLESVTKELEEEIELKDVQSN